VHFDKIKMLQPDLILCNKEENTLDMVTELEPIAPVHISDILDIDDTLDLIKQYGQLFKVEEVANCINNEIKKSHRKFKLFAEHQPRLKVAYLIWQKPYMVVGKDTFINAMLELNNFENVFSGLSRYPEINLDDILQSEPEVIMLSSEPFPFSEKHQREIEELFPKSKTVIVNGAYFSWYGSRLIAGFDYFKKLRQSLLS